MTIIPIHEHPLMNDPDCTLMQVRRGQPGIYRSRNRYIACLPDLKCGSGTFNSFAEAQKWQSRQMQ